MFRSKKTIEKISLPLDFKISGKDVAHLNYNFRSKIKSVGLLGYDFERIKFDGSYISNKLKSEFRFGDKNLMVVVKADGYGHGALTIARALRNENKIIFCVFTIEEALELRDGGITNNIFIFSTLDWLKNNQKNNKNKHYCWNFVNYPKKF